jgi:hypothetical protein
MIITADRTNSKFKSAFNFFDKLIFENITTDIKFWIAGGSLRDYFSIGKINEESDIDIYFASEADFHLLDMYFQSLCSKDNFNFGIRIGFDQDAKFVLETSNSKNYIVNNIKFQLIKYAYYANPKSTLENFDFTVCRCAIDKTNLYYDDEFFIDLARKEINIKHNHNAIGELKRLQKYIKKGYTASDQCLCNIAKAIRDAKYTDNDLVINDYNDDTNNLHKINKFSV